MSFVQIIDFRTSRIDDLRSLGEAWETATEGKRTVRRVILARDRNDPSHYFEIVFFDSYESAMQNSRLSETQQLSEKLFGKADGPPAFYDLDVIDDREG